MRHKIKHLFFAILATLLFVACSNDGKNDEPSSVNAQKLIGTWRYSYIVDLDTILNLLPLISFGEATFNYEWTFNKNETGFVNAYMDYKGNEINAAGHPKNFEYTATETHITFPKFPYETFEVLFNFSVNLAFLPILVLFNLPPLDADVILPYTIEKDSKLTMGITINGELVVYERVPK